MDDWIETKPLKPFKGCVPYKSPWRWFRPVCLVFDGYGLHWNTTSRNLIRCTMKSHEFLAWIFSWTWSFFEVLPNTEDTDIFCRQCFFLSFFDMCYIPIQILPILHSFTRISKFWNSVPSCLPAFAGNLFFPGDVQLHRRKTWRCHAGGVQSGAMQTSKNHETRICPACFFWFQTLVSTWTSILDSLTKMVDRIYQQLVGLTRRSAPVW